MPFLGDDKVKAVLARVLAGGTSKILRVSDTLKEIPKMAKKPSNIWVNKVVKAVRNLTHAELAREGWDTQQRVTALEFNDGSLLYAACDSEGNGPGALFAVTSSGETTWVTAR